MPEPYEDYLRRTGVPPSSCTFCKGQGLNAVPAYVVLRRWNGRELGQLLTYCDIRHHFDADEGFYGGSGERLRATCPVHLD